MLWFCHESISIGKILPKNAFNYFKISIFEVILKRCLFSSRFPEFWKNWLFIGRNIVEQKWQIFESNENLTWRIVSPVENLARKSFTQQDNQNLSEWLVSLVGSLVIHLKTLLLLLSEIFRKAKVTNFSFGDENFVGRIVFHNENFARQSMARSSNLQWNLSKADTIGTIN